MLKTMERKQYIVNSKKTQREYFWILKPNYSYILAWTKEETFIKRYHNTEIREE